jgi:hypothetical protein
MVETIATLRAHISLDEVRHRYDSSSSTLPDTAQTLLIDRFHNEELLLVREIRRLVGLTDSAVGRILQRSGRTHTRHRRRGRTDQVDATKSDRAAQLWRDGMLPAQIASALGLSLVETITAVRARITLDEYRYRYVPFDRRGLLAQAQLLLSSVDQLASAGQDPDTGHVGSLIVAVHELRGRVRGARETNQMPATSSASHTELDTALAQLEVVLDEFVGSGLPRTAYRLYRGDAENPPLTTSEIANRLGANVRTIEEWFTTFALLGWDETVGKMDSSATRVDSVGSKSDRPEPASGLDRPDLVDAIFRYANDPTVRNPASRSYESWRRKHNAPSEHKLRWAVGDWNVVRQLVEVARTDPDRLPAAFIKARRAVFDQRANPARNFSPAEYIDVVWRVKREALGPERPLTKRTYRDVRRDDDPLPTELGWRFGGWRKLTELAELVPQDPHQFAATAAMLIKASQDRRRDSDRRGWERRKEGHRNH